MFDGVKGFVVLQELCVPRIFGKMALQFDGIQHLLTNFFQAGLANRNFSNGTPSISRTISEKCKNFKLELHSCRQKK